MRLLFGLVGSGLVSGAFLDDLIVMPIDETVLLQHSVTNAKGEELTSPNEINADTRSVCTFATPVASEEELIKLHLNLQEKGFLGYKMFVCLATQLISKGTVDSAKRWFSWSSSKPLLKFNMDHEENLHLFGVPFSKAKTFNIQDVFPLIYWLNANLDPKVSKFPGGFIVQPKKNISKLDDIKSEDISKFLFSDKVETNKDDPTEVSNGLILDIKRLQWLLRLLVLPQPMLVKIMLRVSKDYAERFPSSSDEAGGPTGRERFSTEEATSDWFDWQRFTSAMAADRQLENSHAVLFKYLEKQVVATEEKLQQELSEQKKFPRTAVWEWVDMLGAKFETWIMDRVNNINICLKKEGKLKPQCLDVLWHMEDGLEVVKTYVDLRKTSEASRAAASEAKADDEKNKQMDADLKKKEEENADSSKVDPFKVTEADDESIDEARAARAQKATAEINQVAMKHLGVQTKRLTKQTLEVKEELIDKAKEMGVDIEGIAKEAEGMEKWKFSWNWFNPFKKKKDGSEKKPEL